MKSAKTISLLLSLVLVTTTAMSGATVIAYADETETTAEPFLLELEEPAGTEAMDEVQADGSAEEVEEPIIVDPDTSYTRDEETVFHRIMM